MTHYQKRRKAESLKKKREIIKEAKAPEKNIPVFIKKGLIIYTDDASKVEEIKLKYANK